MGGQSHLPNDWVECRKHLGVRQDTGAANAVEEGGFTGVGVPHETDSGEWDGLPLCALHAAGGADARNVSLELGDTAGDAAAVCLELRFARAARPDAASQARHFDAVSGEAWEEVTELRQFHLQLAFAGAGAAGEDIEYELSAVNDFHLELLFQIPQLRRRQFVIEDDRVNFIGIDESSPACPDGEYLLRIDWNAAAR